MLRKTLLLAAVAAAALGPVAPAAARIKLAALPQRERVEIQLDNGHYTLVEEERIVPLLKSGPAGNNKIDFSWTSPQIDKNSIQFRPIAIRDGDGFRAIEKVKTPTGREVPEVNVINVAYPPNENALVWEVYAARACAVKVRVSYLIGDLTRSFSYEALASKDETALTLRKYIQIRNYSGEEFGSSGVWAGFGPKFKKQIGQPEDIKILMAKFTDVPIEKTYTFDWYAHGPLNADKPLASRILMHYRLVNDAEHNLGEFPLQPGKARIFVSDGRGGEAFLGEDWARLTPLDGEMKLFLGEARDIVCTRTLETNRRHKLRGNLFDQEIVIKYEIENFKDAPATLTIVEQLQNLAQQYAGSMHGQVEWDRGAKTSENVRFGYEFGAASPQLFVDLPARPADQDAEVEKVVVRFHVILRNNVKSTFHVLEKERKRS